MYISALCYRTEHSRQGEDGLFLNGARLKVSRRWNLVNWRGDSSTQNNISATSNATNSSSGDTGVVGSDHYLLNLAERFQREPDLMSPMNFGFGTMLACIVTESSSPRGTSLCFFDICV